MAVDLYLAQKGDALQYADQLRECDKLEIYASTGMDTASALAASVGMGNAFIAFIDGEFTALFGCPTTSSLPRTGRPWMVGSKVLDRNPTTVGVHNRLFVQQWQDQHDLLVNHVDARNKKAIAWLTWLGFTLEASRPHGPFNVPFHRFFWVSEHV